MEQKRFFKIFIYIFIAIAFLSLSAGIYFYFTYQSPYQYLPDDFHIYIKISSIKNLYDKIINLKASEIILSAQEYRSLYQGLMDFKSQPFSKNSLFSGLLDVRADLFITETNTPVIILNSNYRAMLLRMIQVLNFFADSKDVNVSKIKVDGIKVTVLTVKNNQKIYLAFRNNLIFVSQNPNEIKKLFNNKKSGKNMDSLSDMKELLAKSAKKNQLEAYLSTNYLLSSAMRSNQIAYKFLKDITLANKCAASINFTEESFSIKIFLKIESDKKILDDFLRYRPKNHSIVKNLPDNSSILTSINFRSLKNFLEVISLFSPPDSLPLEKFDLTSKTLFNMGLDELIFSWIGNEAGAFYIKSLPEPIIFFSIADEKERKKIFLKLEDSLILKDDSNYLVNNVRLNKINLPGIIKAAANIFVKEKIETPYYFILDDYLLLSMDPEALSATVLGYNSGDTILKNIDYKKTTDTLPKNANILVYYNIDTIPAFNAENSLVGKLIGFYKTGALSIRYNQEEIEIFLNGSGLVDKEASIIAGYPKELSQGIEGSAEAVDILGSPAPEIVYINSSNELIIADLNNAPLSITSIEKESWILFPRNQSKAEKEIFTINQEGYYYKINSKGEIIDPFPISLNVSPIFKPLEYKDQFLLFSKNDSCFYLLDNNGKTQKLNIPVEKDVFSEPSIYGNIISYYPKNITGTVYLSSIEGEVKQGWPRDGGGVSYSSPKIVNYLMQNYVLFLTQKGNLNLWKENGKNCDPFPVKLQGIFYSEPIVASASRTGKKIISVLNDEGVVSLIDFDGNIIGSSKISDVEPEAKLEKFDIDKDGIDELFIYNSGNNIFGLDNNLNPLPGFPVKGSRKPCFVDINSDGELDILSAGFDNKLYAYSLKIK